MQVFQLLLMVEVILGRVHVLLIWTRNIIALLDLCTLIVLIGALAET